VFSRYNIISDTDIREALLKTGSVAKNVFEGKKGEYLCVAQTRIVNFTGVF
jgi:hypothetical protein